MPSDPNQIDPSSARYLNYFRNQAAGLLKTIVRARATQEPTFLSPKDFERWDVTDLGSEKRPCAQLLTNVRQLRDQFENRFPQLKGSVSESNLLEESDSIDVLAEKVAGFIVGDLNEAIRIAASGEKVRWDQLANWGELASLRDALDRLPQSPATNADGIQVTARSRRVVLYGPGDAPEVNGTKKRPLTQLRYKWIKRLIEAGEDGCTKSQLESIGADYWKSLMALKEGDADWDKVIHFPGTPHGRYRID